MALPSMGLWAVGCGLWAGGLSAQGTRQAARPIARWQEIALRYPGTAMSPLPCGRSIGVLLLMMVAWTTLQIAWLGTDERIVEGDELTNVGAVELFWEDREGRTAAGELLRAVTGDFGEYPAIYPAVTGIVARWAGVRDLDGDGPARVALVWAWLAVLSTWSIGRRLGGDGAGLLAAAALLLSPLWSALQRHVMPENGVCALVALAAAAGLAGAKAGGEDSRLRRALPWVVAGLAAGMALLAKQTAILALAPLAAGLAFAARSAGGPALATGCALLLAGPWYVARFAREAEYLLGSARANPDAAGALRQAAFYPLVLVQQAWAPAVVAAMVAVVAWMRLVARRRPAPRVEAPRAWASREALILLAVAGGGLLLLLLVPKKYPRLLLPILPILAAVAGSWLAILPGRVRAAVLALAAASLVATALPVPRLSTILAEGHVLLAGMDERCEQDWIAPPSLPGLDWARLLAALEAAGSAGRTYRVGAIAWPAPPCLHQTTLHLGEHLRVRVRRAGLEAFVETTEWSRDGWPEGPPDVLVADGAFDCADSPPACGGIAGATLAGRVRLRHPEWPLDLHVYRLERTGGDVGP